MSEVSIMDPEFDPMNLLLHRPAPRKPPLAPKAEPRPELSDDEVSELLARKYMPGLWQ
jgi:hypothetical protein